jgi:RNA-directed DNA polymerase
VILLLPIFEADMHEHSYAYRPKRNARQAVEAIKQALLSGHTEVLDADLNAYFDSIPHSRLIKLVARRVSDGTMLRLIKAWLQAPIVEEDSSGTRRIHPNKQGTPQGGVISPLLANLYLDELDKTVPKATGNQAVMVRYADDFVICCRPGKGTEVKARTIKWLSARGLKLNEEKTRLVNARRDAFSFVGFTLTWRASHRTGRRYPHVEPSQKSQHKLRAAVRPWLMRWNTWQNTAEVVTAVNQRVRGWQGHFHYANSGTIFRRLNRWLCARLRGWLCRKHRVRWGGYRRYPDERLHYQYGLHQLPETAQWRKTSTA